MKQLHSLLGTLDYTGEIHWNEWGRSWWICDPARETASEAAYIVKTMDEVSQFADYFTYWCLSDIYDQGGFGKEAFCGNYGLISADGLRKPAYYAFVLLSMLGNKRASAVCKNADDCAGAIFTVKNKQDVVVLYNYCETKRSVKFTFNIPEDIKNIEIYRICENQNNNVTRWQNLGSPDYFSLSQLKELRNLDKLTKSDEEVKICDESLEIVLEDAGVAAIVFEK